MKIEIEVPEDFIKICEENYPGVKPGDILIGGIAEMLNTFVKIHNPMLSAVLENALDLAKKLTEATK